MNKYPIKLEFIIFNLTNFLKHKILKAPIKSRITPYQFNVKMFFLPVTYSYNRH